MQFRHASIELCDDRAKRARLQFVVAIEEQHEWRGRVLEAFDASQPLSAVSKLNSAHAAGLDHVPGSIGRAVIDDEHFTIRVLLIDDASDRASDVILVIVAGDDDRELWWAHQRRFLIRLGGRASPDMGSVRLADRPAGRKPAARRHRRRGFALPRARSEESRCRSGCSRAKARVRPDR